MPSASMRRRTSAILSSRPSLLTNPSRSVATKFLLVCAHGFACTYGVFREATCVLGGATISDRTQPSPPYARRPTPARPRSADAGACEHGPRVRKLGRKRRHRIGVGGDPVCTPRHVAAQRALDLRLRSERLQHLHRLRVDACEV